MDQPGCRFLGAASPCRRVSIHYEVRRVIRSTRRTSENCVRLRYRSAWKGRGNVHNQHGNPMRNVLALSLIISVLFLGCDPQPDSPPVDTQVAEARAADCVPLDTLQREAPDRTPAFPEQTRACADPSDVAFDVTVLTTALESPWAVEPLPDGSLLVTEKPGRMRIVSATGEVGPAISGVPEVVDERQGGLLDVALSPSFASDRTIFWSYSEPRDDGNGTSVARGVLSEDGIRLDQVQVILQTRPSYDNGLHFGSRIVFTDNETMFVTIGERSSPATRHQAQELDSHYGKM